MAIRRLPRPALLRIQPRSRHPPVSDLVSQLSRVARNADAMPTIRIRAELRTLRSSFCKMTDCRAPDPGIDQRPAYRGHTRSARWSHPCRARRTTQDITDGDGNTGCWPIRLLLEQAIDHLLLMRSMPAPRRRASRCEWPLRARVTIASSTGPGWTATSSAPACSTVLLDQEAASGSSVRPDLLRDGRGASRSIAALQGSRFTISSREPPLLDGNYRRTKRTRRPTQIFHPVIGERTRPPRH